MSLRCCEAQDENVVCGGVSTTMVHRNETWGIFLGHTIPEMESMRDIVYLPKCVSVLFAPLGVNHGEHTVGAKLRFILMEILSLDTKS